MRKKLVLFVSSALLCGLAACGGTTSSIQSSTQTTVSDSSSSETSSINIPTEYSTHEDFMNAEKGTVLKLKGKLIANTPSENGAHAYYFQDGQGGYHLYVAAGSTLGFDVEIGKSYTIIAEKDYYNGTHELKNPISIEEYGEDIEAPVNDITELEFGTYESMKPYVNSMVNLNKVVLQEKVEVSTKAVSIYVSYGENSVALRLDPKNMTSEEFEAHKKFFNGLYANQTLQIEGAILSSFGYSPTNVSPQLTILGGTKITASKLTGADAISVALASLELVNVADVDVEKIDLTTSVPGLDTKITWASNNEDVIKNDGTIIHPERDTTITLTATATDGDALPQSRSFNVYVYGTIAPEGTLFYQEKFDNLSGEVDEYGNSVIKGSYADGEATFFENYKWQLNNTLHGSSNADKNFDEWSLRLRYRSNLEINEEGEETVVDEEEAGPAAIYTKFKISNISYVDFYAASYGTNKSGILKVSYSIDDGKTWINTDERFEVTPNLLKYRVVFDDIKEDVMIRIAGYGNSGDRANIDNVSFYTKA